GRAWDEDGPRAGCHPSYPYITETSSYCDSTPQLGKGRMWVT
ncbi:hypothetical protein Pmani_036087, partial [Petrolisthes manimaculis]